MWRDVDGAHATQGVDFPRHHLAKSLFSIGAAERNSFALLEIA
jgi:hypothetical protein